MLGKTLKKARNEKRMTMVDLARKIKTSQGAISQIENETRIPSDNSLRRLCTALDLDFEEMVMLRDVKKSEVDKRRILERATSVKREFIDKSLKIVMESNLEGKCFVCGKELQFAGFVGKSVVLFCRCGLEVYIPMEDSKNE